MTTKPSEDDDGPSNLYPPSLLSCPTNSPIWSLLTKEPRLRRLGTVVAAHSAASSPFGMPSRLFNCDTACTWTLLSSLSTIFMPDFHGLAHMGKAKGAFQSSLGRTSNIASQVLSTSRAKVSSGNTEHHAKSILFSTMFALLLGPMGWKTMHNTPFAIPCAAW